MKILLLFILVLPLKIFSLEFSVMTYNVENLFDTNDDLNKDDKAFLPLEKKRGSKHVAACKKISVKKWREECLNLNWNEEAKVRKIENIVTLISSFESQGPDVIALQEVENEIVLQELLDKLRPFGYLEAVLLEGKDYRGIDSAFISKFPILQSQLHYVKFKISSRKRDTRPILQSDINIKGSVVTFYSSHFPAPYLSSDIRQDSFNYLNELLASNSNPSIALGDFNVTREEDSKLQTFKNLSKTWHVAHLEGCGKCKGTYYYEPNKDWSFLDTILISRNRGMSFNPESINLLLEDINSYEEFRRPKSFNISTFEGVSDHFPLVAKIKFQTLN